MPKECIIINEEQKTYEIRVACTNCHCGTDDVILKVFVPLGISAGEFLGMKSLQCPNCKCTHYLEKL